MKEERCPSCQKTASAAESAKWEYHPFCSKRCQQVDLGCWLSDGYVIRGEQDEQEWAEEEEADGA